VQRADQPGLAECRDQAVKVVAVAVENCRHACSVPPARPPGACSPLPLEGSTGDAAWRTSPNGSTASGRGQRLVRRSGRRAWSVLPRAASAGGTRQPRLGVGPRRHRVATDRSVPTCLRPARRHCYLIGKGRVARRGELAHAGKDVRASSRARKACRRPARQWDRCRGVENGQQAAAPAGSPARNVSRPNGSGPLRHRGYTGLGAPGREHTGCGPPRARELFELVLEMAIMPRADRDHRTESARRDLSPAPGSRRRTRLGDRIPPSSRGGGVASCILSSGQQRCRHHNLRSAVAPNATANDWQVGDGDATGSARRSSRRRTPRRGLTWWLCGGADGT